MEPSQARPVSSERCCTNLRMIQLPLQMDSPKPTQGPISLNPTLRHNPDLPELRWLSLARVCWAEAPCKTASGAMRVLGPTLHAFLHFLPTAFCCIKSPQCLVCMVFGLGCEVHVQSHRALPCSTHLNHPRPATMSPYTDEPKSESAFLKNYLTVIARDVSCQWSLRPNVYSLNQ